MDATMVMPTTVFVLSVAGGDEFEVIGVFIEEEDAQTMIREFHAEDRRRHQKLCMGYAVEEVPINPVKRW
jgi:hypothetical protein